MKTYIKPESRCFEISLNRIYCASSRMPVNTNEEKIEESADHEDEMKQFIYNFWNQQ